MKIVLDTNVVLSTFLTQGMSSLVVEKCLKEHRVYISNWIKKEVKGNLRKEKFHFTKNEIEATLKFINSACLTVEPEGKLPNSCRDKDDNNLLLLADYVSARALITGDNDLLTLKKYKKTLILTPRDFYQKYLK